MGDLFLMASFIEHGYRVHELSILNGCRQVLQVTTVADITSGAGDIIMRWAWNGTPNPRAVLLPGWPRKPTMKRAHWRIWQQALRPLLRSNQDLQLLHSLGVWLAPPPRSWRCFYSPSGSRLFLRQGHLWNQYCQLPLRLGVRDLGVRDHGGDFVRINGICLEIPEDLERANERKLNSIAAFIA
jgi:hypothetical protein